MKFRRPRLGRAQNVVISSLHVEAFEVAYDHLASPPRFVALRMEYMTGGRRYGEFVPYVSKDGLKWSKPKGKAAGWDSPGVLADRSTFFLNPSRAERELRVALKTRSAERACPCTACRIFGEVAVESGLYRAGCARSRSGRFRCEKTSARAARRATCARGGTTRRGTVP